MAHYRLTVVTSEDRSDSTVSVDLVVSGRIEGSCASVYVTPELDRLLRSLALEIGDECYPTLFP